MPIRLIHYLQFVFILFSFIAIEGCGDFKIANETFVIEPSDKNVLEDLSSKEIADLVNEPSVGNNIEIDGTPYFIPINYEYTNSPSGSVDVYIGDIEIRGDVNKYNAIGFNPKKHIMDASYKSKMIHLFFVPSKDSTAISIEKLKLQYDNDIYYFDENSLITKDVVIQYNYNKDKKEFEILFCIHNFILSDLSHLERLYELIDVLRLAKNLKKTTIKTMDWDYLENVIPVNFPRYFTPSLINDIIENTKYQPENFAYVYQPLDLQFEVYIVKDSSLNILHSNLKASPINNEFDIRSNYSKESIRILSDYMQFFDERMEIYKTTENTYYINQAFGHLVFYFIPEKNLLFVYSDEYTNHFYFPEICIRYFNQNLIPALEDISFENLDTK